MRSKNVSWDVPLTFKSHVHGPAKEETQEYDVGCFQSICVFFSELETLQNEPGRSDVLTRIMAQSDEED